MVRGSAAILGSTSQLVMGTVWPPGSGMEHAANGLGPDTRCTATPADASCGRNRAPRMSRKQRSRHGAAPLSLRGTSAPDVHSPLRTGISAARVDRDRDVVVHPAHR